MIHSRSKIEMVSPYSIFLTRGIVYSIVAFSDSQGKGAQPPAPRLRPCIGQNLLYSSPPQAACPCGLGRVLQYGASIEVQCSDEINTKNAKMYPKGLCAHLLYLCASYYLIFNHKLDNNLKWVPIISFIACVTGSINAFLKSKLIYIIVASSHPNILRKQCFGSAFLCGSKVLMKIFSQILRKQIG